MFILAINANLKQEIPYIGVAEVGFQQLKNIRKNKMKKKYKFKFNTRRTLGIINKYNNPSELKKIFNKYSRLIGSRYIRAKDLKNKRR